jgi:predicted transcriptional regulator
LLPLRRPAIDGSRLREYNLMQMRDKSSERRFTPPKTGSIAPLGHLERAVMTVVWKSEDPLLVNDVHTALAEDTKQATVAYSTVKSTMERLAEKGILAQVRTGKAYQYRATLSEADLERRIVTTALDRLVSEFPQAVASFFVRPDPAMTEERLALLKDAIERQREHDKDTEEEK